MLQRADPGAGSDDRHKVAVLHLFVDKLLERAADEVRALERKREIVDDQCDGPSDLLGPHPRRWGYYCGFVFRFFFSLLNHTSVRDKREVRDLLLLAILEDLYLIRAEVCDNVSLFVGHGHIELYQGGRDLYDVGFVGRRRRRSGRGRLGAGVGR